MSLLGKYKNNILKQYGKNIKAHEDRLDKQLRPELMVSHFHKRGGLWYESYEDLKA